MKNCRKGCAYKIPANVMAWNHGSTKIRNYGILIPLAFLRRDGEIRVSDIITMYLFLFHKEKTVGGVGMGPIIPG